MRLSELVDDVVARVTRATGGAQTPWVAHRETFGDYAIADVIAGVAPAPLAPAPLPGPSSPPR